MHKFCKSSLCVEKVRESDVLIGRLVDVPGVDAIRFAVLMLICLEPRLCSIESEARARRLQKTAVSPKAGRRASRTC